MNRSWTFPFLAIAALALLMGSIAVGDARAANIVPEIACANESIFACQDGSYCFPTTVLDPGAGGLVFSIPDGSPATIDPATGELCVSPDTGGDLEIQITATDAAGSHGRCTAVFAVAMNSAPELSLGADTTIHLCVPTQICLPVAVSDSDDNLMNVATSLGEYVDGYVCFIPYKSGDVVIEVTATDECGLTTRDVITVAITNSEAVEVVCPKDQLVFTCQLDTFCFPIEINGIPEGNEYTVDVTGLNTWWNAETSEVCFFSECAFTNTITVIVTDACGTYSCSFDVEVGCNQPTQVVLPPDTTIGMCSAEGGVCVPVGINDPDGNLLNLTVDGGVFDAATGLICVDDFIGDTHQITVLAEDECGELTSTEMLLRLGNEPPVATCPLIDPISVCDYSEAICVDGFAYSDPDNNVSSATVNGVTITDGSVCFYPDEGENELEFIVTDDCGLADTCITVVTVNGNRPPTCSGPSDTTVSICEGETVCLPLFADDPDGNFDEFQITYGGGEVVDGMFCYTTDVPRTQNFTIWAIDSCNAHCEMSFQVIFDVDQNPEITDRYTSEKFCDPVESREVGVAYWDPDGDDLFFEILSGEGTIDNNGQITYYPTTDGIYRFEVAVSDACGGDTGIVEDTITFNNPPVLITGDQKIYLCDVAEVCFDVIAHDPDGDNIEIYQKLGPGWFEALTDSSGQTCFSPDDVDSATYVFAYCAVDPCDYVKSGVQPPFCPPCEPDTVRITIIIDRPPTITCPGEQIFSVCEPTELCFDVAGEDPEGGPLTFELVGSYDNVSINGTTVCFMADVTTSFDLHVQVSDTCGHTDDCIIPVAVDVNRPPVVTIPEDFTTSICEPGTVCFDASVDDLDGDLSDASVTYGEFDGQQICFWADTAGVYEIILWGTDECQQRTEDTIHVTITFGEAPTVSLPDDFASFVCVGEEICFDVSLTGDYETVVPSFGSYDPSTGQVCFVPETSGDHFIEVTVSGVCGSDADSITITIDRNNPPEISQMKDTSVYLCYPTEMCLPVAVFDPDDNIASVEVSHGTYADGQVCFIPYDGGTYEIVVTVTDECGITATSSATVTVETDQGISITCPGDTSIFACESGTYCFPIELSGLPEAAVIEVIGVNAWFDEAESVVCFSAECGFTNPITVLAITPCDTISCSFTVTIECNQPPVALLPPDTSISLCVWEWICVPVAVDDPDGNLVEISFDGFPYLEYDPYTSQVCFFGQESGDYEIIVNAIDSCGEIGSDTMIVHLWANTPPYLEYCCDTLIEACAEEVCVPIGVCDADGIETVVEVTTSIGYYDPIEQELCFTVDDTSGTYCIEVIAIDSCGAADTAMACVPVQLADMVTVQCPLEPFIVPSMCEPNRVCIPLDVIGEDYTIHADFGTVEDDVLCFWADTSGTYRIGVSVEGPCNGDYCEIVAIVDISSSNLISCPGDTAVALCHPETMCFDFEVSPSATSVTVTQPAGAYIDAGQVCVPIGQSGQLLVQLVAVSECGPDTCEFNITSTINTPPEIVLGNDTTIRVCEPVELCFPVTITDAEDNVGLVTTTVLPSGSATIVDGQVCFTPPDFGTYTITVRAEDTCDESSSDELIVAVNQGGRPVMQWFGGEFYALCNPDSIHVLIGISPPDADVDVSYGVFDAATDTISFWADTSGIYRITVRVAAECGDTTDTFEVSVTVGEEPTVSCVGQIDTLVCLEEPVQICYDVVINDPTAIVTLLDDPDHAAPDGVVYDNGEVCINVSAPDTYGVGIAVHNDCGDDTCWTVIDVTADQMPELFLPVGPFTYYRCDDDLDVICVEGIYATDAEGIDSLVMRCGTGEFTNVRVDSGYVCLPADIAYGLHEYCFVTYDGCHTDSGSFFVEVFQRPDCEVCMYLTIENNFDDCVEVGIVKEVPIYIETEMFIGGFDILIGYGASELTFRGVQIGAAIAGDAFGWEYFAHRIIASGGAGIPSGLVRFVGIADINNGPVHPDHATLNPNGTLLIMEFLIANDQNLGDTYLPIQFVTLDCGDNAVSDTTGTELYVDLRIYNPYDRESYRLVWDEADNATYPESSRDNGQGTPDACFGGGKVDPIRCIEYYNGGICIVHPDSIDARGDLNLNGVPYEIADAVVFSNYFIYGLSVFTVNVAGQIAASDVNADGATLQVADLVLLIRVVIGDTPPIPKLTPHEDALIVSTTQELGQLSIATESSDEIGAGLFVFDLEGDVGIVDAPKLTEASGDLDLIWSIQDGQLRILVLSIGQATIPAGAHDIIQIPYRGNGSITLSETEIVDYYGQPYLTVTKGSSLPAEFSLGQNYPNPFNPTTTISFSLATASDWNLSIYNINGEMVSDNSGSSAAGHHVVTWNGTNSDGTPVASGIYFYRLEATDFSETRKMVLLK